MIGKGSEISSIRIYLLENKLEHQISGVLSIHFTERTIKLNIQCRLSCLEWWKILYDWPGILYLIIPGYRFGYYCASDCSATKCKGKFLWLFKLVSVDCKRKRKTKISLLIFFCYNFPGLHSTSFVCFSLRYLLGVYVTKTIQWKCDDCCKCFLFFLCTR